VSQVPCFAARQDERCDVRPGVNRDPNTVVDRIVPHLGGHYDLEILHVGLHRPALPGSLERG
jgi:hypothetical protein